MSPLSAGSDISSDVSRVPGPIPVAPRTSVSLPVGEASHVGEARRAVVSLASLLGFSDTQQSNVAIIVTEAANNLLQHAGSGEIIVRALVENGIAGLELVTLDKGPGMGDVSRCLEDGFSTAGTPGTGLGAMQRLSASFDVYTRPGFGAALRMTAWARPRATAQDDIGEGEVGVVSRPKPGQDVCGDSWATAWHGRRQVFFVVDGLGHGPDAAQAARAAVSVFEACSDEAPQSILRQAHDALKDTRGAAAAVATVNLQTQTVTFAGVGNIAGAVLTDDQVVSMVSHHGIVGYQLRKIQEFTYPCAPGSVLLLSSDGLATLNLHYAYPGLLSQPPGLIAGVLYRDFQRPGDDSTLVVARIGETEGGVP